MISSFLSVAYYRSNYADKSSDRSNSAGQYRFVCLDAHNFEACKLALEKGRLERFRQRLLDGFHAFGYVSPSGQVISYLWVTGLDGSRGLTPFEGGLVLETLNDEVYVWDCRTEIGYEGRGLYRSGLHEIKNMVGRRSVTIASRVENDRSCRAIEASGFRLTSYIRIFKFCNILLVNNGRRWLIAKSGEKVNIPGDLS